MNVENLVNACIISSEILMFKIKVEKKSKLNYSHVFCMIDVHYRS